MSPDILAKLLRRKQDEETLRDANTQAHQFDELAAIAQMANNPGVSSATKMAAESSQKRHKPVTMGVQGFALPSQGSFISSPMFEDEQDESRAARKSIADGRLQEAEASRTLREVLARLADTTRRSEGEQNRALRQSLAILAESGRNSRADASGGSGGGANKGRSLQPGQIEKLAKMEGVSAAFNDLAGSFDARFSGTPGIAAAENVLGKYQPLGIGGKYADQANWWQNYNEQKNTLRNTLFGSALTKTEKDAFEKATITEGMNAEEIQRRLGQQQAAASRAYNKLLDAYGKGGFDVSEFSTTTAPKAAAPGQSAENPLTPAELAELAARKKRAGKK